MKNRNTENSKGSEEGLDWLDAVALGQPTPGEIAACRRELAGRPAELQRLAEELAVNAALEARPGAPQAATHFASQVWSKIEAEERAALRGRPAGARRGWLAWLSLRPVFGLAMAAAVALGFSWQAWTFHRRSQLAAGAATVALTSTSGLTAESVDDFEVIRRLSVAPRPNDEALIAALAENSAQ